MMQWPFILDIKVGRVLQHPARQLLTQPKNWTMRRIPSCSAPPTVIREPIKVTTWANPLLASLIIECLPILCFPLYPASTLALYV